MKLSLLTWTFSMITFTSAVSLANCLGENQLVSRISQVTQISSDKCLAQISYSDVIDSRPNFTCDESLEASDIVQQGITVSLNSEGQCSVKKSDILRSVIYVNEKGELRLAGE